MVLIKVNKFRKLLTQQCYKPLKNGTGSPFCCTEILMPAMETIAYAEYLQNSKLR